MMKMTFLMVVLMATTMTAFAQTSAADTLAYPEVGKKMPDFTVRNIKYFGKSSLSPHDTPQSPKVGKKMSGSVKRNTNDDKKVDASLADFAGKWLVLDFWNKGCGACFQAFPITNKIHEEMSDKVQVILVGIQDKEGQIEKIYDKFRERLHLTMPCAFDSNLAKRFDVYTAPHIVIVDPNGVVQSVTYAVNQEDMKGFIAGNPPSLPQTYYRMHDDRISEDKFKYNPRKPFLVNNNGGVDSEFMCRSILSKWNGKVHKIYAPSRIDEFRNGKFETLGMPLEFLYKYAYLGKYKWNASDSNLYGNFYGELVLDIKDSEKFDYSYKYSKNLFSYSLILPTRNASKDDLEIAMQKDLQIFFGYNVVIENRKCPYFKIISIGNAREKLKSKGGAISFEGIKDASFKARNYPVSEFVKIIQYYIFDYVIDETGIVGNIDIDMDCVMTDLEDVRKALQRNGLDLIKDEISMKAIVIHEKEKQMGIASTH